MSAIFVIIFISQENSVRNISQIIYFMICKRKDREKNTQKCFSENKYLLPMMGPEEGELLNTVQLE